jgi:hypothetical protein
MNRKKLNLDIPSDAYAKTRKQLHLLERIDIDRKRSKVSEEELECLSYLDRKYEKVIKKLVKKINISIVKGGISENVSMPHFGNLSKLSTLNLSVYLCDVEYVMAKSNIALSYRLTNDKDDRQLYITAAWNKRL